MTDHNGSEERAVGFLRLFHVQAKKAGEVRWAHDVVARTEEDAEKLAVEFILTDESLAGLAAENLNFAAKRAGELKEPYGWVIGVRP